MKFSARSILPLFQSLPIGVQRHAVTGLVLAFGLVISLTLFVVLRSSESDRIRRDFQQLSQDRISAIRKTLEIDALEITSVKSFVDGSDNVERHEFQAFAAPMLQGSRSIHTLLWAPRVSETDRAAFEETAAHKSEKGIGITEHDAERKLTAAAARKEYFPVSFVEPFQDNAEFHGYDLATNPACLDAMHRSRDSGKLASTSKLLSDIRAGSLEIWLFLPIYRKAAAPSTIEERRKELKGFIVGAIHIRGIIEELLSTLQPTGIDIYLFDQSNPRHPVFLYAYPTFRLLPPDSDDKPQLPAGDSVYQLTQTIDVGGKSWAITCAASPDFIAGRTTWYPWCIGGACLLLTGLLGVYLVRVAAQDARASSLLMEVADANRLLEREIIDRELAEATLRASQTKYQTLFESSSDAIMLRSAERSILDANPAAITLFRCDDLDDLMTLAQKGFYPEYQPDGTRSSVKVPQIIAVAKEKGSHLCEWTYRRKDGSEFTAMVTLTALQMEGETLALSTIRDITEQKRSQESLRISQAKYKALFDSSSDAIMLRTADRKLLDANPAAVALFGCKDVAEMASLMPLGFYPEYQPDGMLSTLKAQQMVETALQSGSNFLEWTYKRKDGTEFFATLLLTKIELGGDTLLLSTVRDVTEQKQAEEALQTSQARYKALFDYSTDAIMIRTTDRRVIDANSAAVALFRCNDLNELCSGDPFAMFPEFQPDGSRSVEKANEILEIAKQKGSHIFEWKYLRKDGTEFFANVLLTELFMKGKRFTQTTIRDITPQKEAEEAVRSSERRYRLLAENMSDVIWTMDFSGRFTYFSPSVRQMLGYQWDESGNFLIERVMTSESFAVVRKILAEVTEARQNQQRINPGTVELEQIRKNGTTLWTEVSYSGMFNESGQVVGLQGVTRDISERRRMEVDLRNAKNAAEAATHAKSTFLASMSHEIRTPMTAILGYADLLMTPNVDASTRYNYLTVIRRNGEHLLGLINDILDLSKIEAGKLSLDIRRCNAMAVLADVASLVRPRAEQAGVSLSVEYPGEFPETILTDDARLRQTVVNLVGNAVKFTKQGSVRIAASFLPDWTDHQPAIQIDVIDTGIGIRPEVLPKLFQSFSQGDSSVSREFGGTGLGLAISRHLAEMLGGILTAKSVWGQGSCFTLILPTGDLQSVTMLYQPVEIEQQSSMQPLSVSRHALKGIHVLLAEDGLDNRELISTILRNAGAKVDTAENGAIAVARAKAEEFDLILMDMNMPEMDGYAATSVLRDSGYTKPILALTANAMAGDNERCLAAGCNEHLPKPINRAQLIRTIFEFAGEKRSGTSATPAHNRTLENKPTTQSRETRVGNELNFSSETSPNARMADTWKPLVSDYINDPEITSILKDFVKRLPDQIEAMRNALAAGQFDKLQRLAHQLKGAGGSYGYPLLTDACKTLEEIAKVQALDKIPDAIHLVAALAQAIQEGYTLQSST